MTFPLSRPSDSGTFGQLVASKGPHGSGARGGNGWLRPCAGRMPVCIYTEATRFRPAPLQRRMQGTIEHNSLGDIIFIHDWTDNVEEAVRSVHCIVRPDPTGSPWGRDIIEAMSMGRPVIAAGEEEVFIKPGKNGLAGTPRRYRSPRRNLERPFALRHGTGKKWDTMLSSSHRNISIRKKICRARKNSFWARNSENHSCQRHSFAEA